MKNPDFDDDEKEFQRDLKLRLGGARQGAVRCPEPDALMAAVSGVMFESAEQVLRHREACRICQQLIQDMIAYEHPGVSIEEDRRLRSRWPQQTKVSRVRPSMWEWIWRPVPIAAAAAIVAAVLLGMWRIEEPPNPTPAANNIQQPQPSFTPPAAARSTIFVLEKPAIKIPAAVVLLYRSSGEDGRVYLNELASALEPYRADDYAEAVRRLEILSSRYRESGETYFYLGVSRLFRAEDAAAVESLRLARRFADETLAGDVSWYLAIALDRNGLADDALKEVEQLCGSSNEYKERACLAAEELRKR